MIRYTRRRRFSALHSAARLRILPSRHVGHDLRVSVNKALPNHDAEELVVIGAVSLHALCGSFPVGQSYPSGRSHDDFPWPRHPFALLEPNSEQVTTLELDAKTRDVDEYKLIVVMTHRLLAADVVQNTHKFASLRESYPLLSQSLLHQTTRLNIKSPNWTEQLIKSHSSSPPSSYRNVTSSFLLKVQRAHVCYILQAVSAQPVSRSTMILSDFRWRKSISHSSYTHES